MWLAAVAVGGYVLDAMGFGVAPGALLGLGLTVAGAGAFMAVRGRPRINSDVAIWTGIIVFVTAATVRVSWPELVPPGRGPDLAHHLLLVDYIEQHGHLVHDRALEGAMGEMAHYTPGAHLLAVVIGKWSGTGGLRAFFPLLVLCTALTAGYVFLIGRRLLLPAPFALVAVILLFLPAQYFSGAFTHDSFLAQTAATCFAVAAWWALVAWDQEGSRAAAAIFSLLIVAVFLTWPVFAGPLVIVFLAMVWRPARLADAAIVLVPLCAIATVHLSGRWGWLGLVGTSGAVLAPSLATVGWLLPLLAAGGLLIGARDRRARVSLILLLMIALQALTLFVLATMRGASTPYMAYKMAHLAIYPMAIFGALAIGSLRQVLGGRADTVAWMLAAILVLIAVRPALTAPRTVPVVDLDLYAAGKWVRDNIGQTCVDYLVADAETAYWLHLAVLGNPRSAARMAEIDRYDPRSAMAPWLTATGRGYAIADARVLPDEVRTRVAIERQFGNAVVIKRPGAVICRSPQTALP